MSRRRAATIGGGITFVLAGGAGAAGGQLAENTMWAWVCLLATLFAGGLVTGWTTWHTTNSAMPSASDVPPSGPADHRPPPGGVTVGNVSGEQVAGVNYGEMTQHRTERRHGGSGGKRRRRSGGRS